MITKDYAGLTVKVLENNERDIGYARLSDDLERRKTKQSLIQISTPGGYMSGTRAIEICSRFPDDVPRMTLKQNIDFAPNMVSLAEALKDADPGFWLYPYLAGNAILSASEVREEFIRENHKEMGSSAPLRKFREDVKEVLKAGMSYLSEAHDSWNAYRKSDEILKFHSTNIALDYVQARHRLVNLTYMTEPSEEDFRKKYDLNKFEQDAEEVQNLYVGVALNGVFESEIKSAIAIANLGNAMRLTTNPAKAKKALSLFYEVRQVMGRNEKLDTQIAELESKLAEPEDKYGLGSRLN